MRFFYKITNRVLGTRDIVNFKGVVAAGLEAEDEEDQSIQEGTIESEDTDFSNISEATPGRSTSTKAI